MKGCCKPPTVTRAFNFLIREADSLGLRVRASRIEPPSLIACVRSGRLRQVAEDRRHFGDRSLSLVTEFVEYIDESPRHMTILEMRI